MEPAIGLVVVFGGVAEAYAPSHTCVRIVDVDNVKDGEPPVELPSGIGFEELVREADLEDYVKFEEKNDEVYQGENQNGD